MGFLWTAELNWLGWGALVASSGLVGVAGWALATLVHWPGWPLAAGGVALVPVGLMLLDRRTWRNGQTFTGPSWDADAEGLTQIAQDLRELGYDVTVDLVSQDRPTLVVRNRDLERVREQLR